MGLALLANAINCTRYEDGALVRVVLMISVVVRKGLLIKGMGNETKTTIDFATILALCLIGLFDAHAISPCLYFNVRVRQVSATQAQVS